MTDVERMTDAARRAHEAMVKVNPAMQGAASSLAKFGRIYDEAIQSEMNRLKAVRQTHPRGRRLKRDA